MDLMKSLKEKNLFAVILLVIQLVILIASIISEGGAQYGGYGFAPYNSTFKALHNVTHVASIIGIIIMFINKKIGWWLFLAARVAFVIIQHTYTSNVTLLSLALASFEVFIFWAILQLKKDGASWWSLLK